MKSGKLILIASSRGSQRAYWDKILKANCMFVGNAELGAKGAAYKSKSKSAAAPSLKAPMYEDLHGHHPICA